MKLVILAGALVAGTSGIAAAQTVPSVSTPPATVPPVSTPSTTVPPVALPDAIGNAP